MRFDDPTARDPRPDRERQVGRAFVELADTLVDDYDTLDLLDRLVTHCVHLLAADAAAIMLADAGGELRTVASSSEDAEFIELLQLQAGDGPCMQCFRYAAPVSAPDITTTDRWPAFTEAATSRSLFRSVHALPLRLRGDAIGALNLMHHRPGPLPAQDLALGQALADVATIGILAERSIRRSEVLAEQLQTALNNRVVIEQAKGILAQQAGLTIAEAFDRLRDYSRRNNLRLADVARAVTAGQVEPATVAERRGTARRR
ncbi:GAF and ANTAR domain-containing protein [Pseudonocardia pini]|uniref:GAF and ANTAR domain-containing protein n=1 Tax=Pseudonocardia pini TaxID=2758030 RepID=UPI0015F06342|nr:GAF and ANTAR domain-containing protein [Pseudonocardia pini]